MESSMSFRGTWTSHQETFDPGIVELGFAQFQMVNLEREWHIL